MFQRFLETIKRNPNELSVYVEKVPTDSREVVVHISKSVFIIFCYDSHDSILYVSSTAPNAKEYRFNILNEGCECIAGGLSQEDADRVCAWYRATAN